MSDKTSSIRILNDAKRLNMMDGHFVWVWIDTAAVINVKNSTDEAAESETNKRNDVEDGRFIRNADQLTDYEDLEEFYVTKRPASRAMDEMNINYLLQNDQYLLFNRNNDGVESSKLKDRRSDFRKRKKKNDSVAGDGGGSNDFGELPAGLLSLKPLPVKVDRHLVKGAVRLLVSVLNDVLEHSPWWMIKSLVAIQNNGCWKNIVIKESSFINDFGK